MRPGAVGFDIDVLTVVQVFIKAVVDIVVLAGEANLEHRGYRYPK